MMQPYQQVCSDHLVARLIAAILYKLGETSITISSRDLESLPVGQIEATGDPFGGAVTYAFRQAHEHGQGDLVAESLPAPPPIAEDPMPQTRARNGVPEHLNYLNGPAAEPLFVEKSVTLPPVEPRDTSLYLVSELGDDELKTEYARLKTAWERGLVSPMPERMKLIEHEQQRRHYARD